MAADDIAVSPVLSPGAQVGNYLIVGPLGQGGTSMVYRAAHAHVGREVALKVLGPDYPKSRFLSEARAIGSIAPHPNIVEIFDCGKTDDGQLYYVMELLQGHDLSQMLAGRSLTPEEALPYLDQVCAGLEAAHRMGVVHRDVKLTNIFVLDGEPLRLKLFDFGVARLPELLTADMAATCQGTVIGTPTSMAPEQAAGQPDRVGPHTDIYAVGVMLFQMLAGRSPFEEQDVASLLSCHINTEPPPLTNFASVPQSVADVVHRCLRKAPADRYQTAEGLYQAFSDAVNADLEAREESSAPADIEQRDESPSASASWSGLALPASVADRSGPSEMARLSTGALERISRPDRREQGPSHWLAWIGGVALLLVVAAMWVLLRDDGATLPAADAGVAAEQAPAVDAAATVIDAATAAVPDATSQAADAARPRAVRKKRPVRKSIRRRRAPAAPLVLPAQPEPDQGPPPLAPAGTVLDVKPSGP